MEKQMKGKSYIDVSKSRLIITIIVLEIIAMLIAFDIAIGLSKLVLFMRSL